MHRRLTYAHPLTNTLHTRTHELTHERLKRAQISHSHNTDTRTDYSLTLSQTKRETSHSHTKSPGVCGVCQRIRLFITHSAVHIACAS